MKSTRKLIKNEIERFKLEIERLEFLIKEVKDEPSRKECPNCKTENLHYIPLENNWCCAFC